MAEGDGECVVVIGAAVMKLVYRMQQFDWQVWAVRLQQWLQGPQRSLILPLAGGSIAAFGAYLTASVWVDATSLGLLWAF